MGIRILHIMHNIKVNSNLQIWIEDIIGHAHQVVLDSQIMRLEKCLTIVDKNNNNQ